MDSWDGFCGDKRRIPNPKSFASWAIHITETADLNEFFHKSGHISNSRHCDANFYIICNAFLFSAYASHLKWTAMQQQVLSAGHLSDRWTLTACFVFDFCFRLFHFISVIVIQFCDFTLVAFLLLLTGEPLLCRQ